MNDNRTRIFSEVLSLDAWHEAFNTNGKTASVFVELSFREGQIGGDSSDFPFTFRISLKRALVTVHVESPLELDRGSIERSFPDVDLERLHTRTDSSNSETNMAAFVKLSPVGIGGSMRAEGKVKQGTKVESVDKRQETLKQTIVAPIPVDRRTYSWELTPGDGSHLLGQPWHPIKPPRLAVKSLSKIPKLEPGISVTISCALSDVIISDIEYKNPPPLVSLDRVVPKNTTAVAIQHLKKILVEADLEPGALDDRFSRIILGMVMSCTE